MSTVTSKDGTRIVYDQTGAGPALILVGGLLEHREMASETAQLYAHPLLAENFTVFHYDRRGRGESTDTKPYAVEREIEDIEALIDAAGGPVFLSGISSGAALVFETALALGGRVKKVALYEPPYNDDNSAREAWKGFRKDLNDELASGRRGGAVALFMSLLGAAPDQIEVIRQAPMWPAWEAMEHTIAYDAAVLGEDASLPLEKAGRLAVPTLVINGGESYEFMGVTAQKLAAAIPQARHCVLEGQTHEVAAEALAPVLVEFFNSNDSAGRQ